MRHSFSGIILLGLLLSATGNSQFYFGRNKIQYDQFQWQTLKTEHFNIYFYREEQDIAFTAAGIAEETFREYVNLFEYQPDEKIPLILYASPVQFRQTNVLPNQIPEGIGGFFEFIKGRVVLPYNGRIWDFYHVIRHELVHVFTNKKVAYHLRKEKRWNTTSLPLWFTEGLAEWWSIGWDNQAETVLRDAVLQDKLKPLHKTGGFLLYKEGQSFFRFFQNRFGQEAILTLLETYWQFDSFEAALEQVTGIKYEDLLQEWSLSLKKKFAAALENETLPPVGNSLLTTGRINSAPALYWKRDSTKQIIYQSNRDGFTNIYQQSLKSREPTLILKGERTPDYESLHLLQSEMAVNQFGELVFPTLRQGRDVLVILDLYTGVEKAELFQKELVSIRSPNWSQDGKTVVFSGSRFSGFNDLYLWKVKPDILIRLTNDQFADWDPVFSPYGEKILFSSDRGNVTPAPAMNLFLLDYETGVITAVTDDEYENIKPRCGPGNKNIIHFLSNRSGINNIWELNIGQQSEYEELGEIYQETNYHTGVTDFIPVTGDSMALVMFQDYGFRIHYLELETLDRPGKIEQRTTNISSPMEVDSLQVTEKPLPYKLKYTFDIAQTAVAFDPQFGFLGGGQISVSDILGNRYFNFMLSNSAQTPSEFLSRFNVAVTFVDLSQRSNVALGAFYFSNDYFDPYQAFYYEQTVGVRGGINVPINVFDRFEMSISLWQSRKKYAPGDQRSATLIANTISLVHDNSLWSLIGPIDGWRGRITVSPTFDLSRARIYNYTGLLDFRYYYHPNSKLTLAHRMMILANDGKDVRRFYIGGSWGLRGYPFNGIYGRKYVLLNTELRFPLVRSLTLDSESVNVDTGPWEGALFVDVGNAWEQSFQGFIGSLGFGLRVRFGGAVLRWDIGKRTDFSKLQEGWFTQFFFGWDF
ncbi:MAG: BamA/TamA family outer membrane protein [Fidelibacterota bacterium]